MAAVQSAQELRVRVRGERKAGRLAWVDLRGLAIDGHDTHAGLLRAASAFGLGIREVRSRPTTAVLDWSYVSTVPAEGLSFLVVLAHALSARGVAIVMCEPELREVAVALDESGIRQHLPDVVWIPIQTAGEQRRARVLVPLIEFAGKRGTSAIAPFLSTLDAALSAQLVDVNRAALITATAMEVIQNVLAHADTEFAASIAVLHYRRRPPVITMGIADAGVGIGTSMLDHPRHAWMTAVADRGATSAVFGTALSRRDADQGGGGMVRIIRRLVEEAGATVLVRSGAACATIRSDHTKKGGSALVSIAGHTVGWGTQTHVSIPIR
jgi:hypothetical protein